jgi:hypothetical protein
VTLRASAWGSPLDARRSPRADVRWSIGVRSKALALSAALILGSSGEGAAAQLFQSEGRIDLFFAHGTTVQVGGGGAWMVDRNVRVVALGGLGSTLYSGQGQLSARADVLARFVLDPDRVDRWALYGAGGLGVRYLAAPSWRGVLVALVGIEGPVWGSITPFVEAGYGGGFQLGFGVRRARSRGR